MKRIVLLGDSNFCGEWFTNINNYNAYWGDITEIKLKYNKQFKHDYSITHPGLEHFLRIQGHNVVNGATGGGSNLDSALKLFQNLFLTDPFFNSRFTIPDLFIIILTEPLRELYYLSPYSSEDNESWSHFIRPLIDKSATTEELNKNLLKLYFDTLQDIYDLTKIPIILVEGWGKDLGILDQYTFFTHIEKNWLGKELGVEIPMICGMRTYDATAKVFNTESFQLEKSRYIEEVEELMDKLVESEKFPDNGHPNYKVHQALADKLAPVIDSIPDYRLPEINYKEYIKNVYR